MNLKATAMTHYEADQTVQGAFALLRAVRPLEAAQLFRKVIADHPRNAHALNGLGTIALAAATLVANLTFQQFVALA